MERGDPRKLLTAVAKRLAKLRIPYFVTGGMAVLIWGRPRFTADIDIVIQLVEPKVKALLKALQAIAKKGYVDETTAREALHRKGKLNFIDPETGVKVDFWIARNDEFLQMQLKRRRHRKVNGETVYFISPEDLILNKIIWYTSASSSGHLEDIESIFKISGDTLDLVYLKKWIKKLGLPPILNL